jgi:hypothetical protein
LEYLDPYHLKRGQKSLPPHQTLQPILDQKLLFDHLLKVLQMEKDRNQRFDSLAVAWRVGLRELAAAWKAVSAVGLRELAAAWKAVGLRELAAAWTAVGLRELAVAWKAVGLRELSVAWKEARKEAWKEA